MATDQVITPRDLMDAVMRVRRAGVNRSLEELEQQEPDLAEVVLEELSAVHHRLLEAGMSARRTRRLIRRVESLVLVAIAAARQGHRRLWETPPHVVNESARAGTDMQAVEPNAPSGDGGGPERDE